MATSDKEQKLNAWMNALNQEDPEFLKRAKELQEMQNFDEALEDLEWIDDID
jgi:hypothetical protein